MAPQGKHWIRKSCDMGSGWRRSKFISNGCELRARNARPFSARIPPSSLGSICGESDDEDEHHRAEHEFIPNGVRVFDCERQNKSKTPDSFDTSPPARDSHGPQKLTLAKSGWAGVRGAKHRLPKVGGARCARLARRSWGVLSGFAGGLGAWGDFGMREGQGVTGFPSCAAWKP